MSPDLSRDVIVEHVHDAAGRRWVVLLGGAKRAELDDANRAVVFARLLADLQQRPVWLRHAGESELQPVDRGALRGCSCC